MGLRLGNVSRIAKRTRRAVSGTHRLAWPSRKPAENVNILYRVGSEACPAGASTVGAGRDASETGADAIIAMVGSTRVEASGLLPISYAADAVCDALRSAISICFEMFMVGWAKGELPASARFDCNSCVFPSDHHRIPSTTDLG